MAVPNDYLCIPEITLGSGERSRDGTQAFGWERLAVSDVLDTER
jgi:hypothetical protein